MMLIVAFTMYLYIQMYNVHTNDALRGAPGVVHARAGMPPG